MFRRKDGVVDRRCSAQDRRHRIKKPTVIMAFAAIEAWVLVAAGRAQ